MATSSTNLSPNIASALCYAPFIGWIVSIVMLIVEKNTSIKWDAAQSILLSVVVMVVVFVLPFTIILIPLVPVVWLASLVLSLVLTVKAYQGNSLKLPVLSGWADKLVKKM